MTESVVVAPEGDIDIARVAEFRAALSRAAGAPTVVVDLSGVSFIDSSGLGALVELDNRLRRDRRQLAVVAPAGTAAALLLNLAGLQTRMSIFPTREAAQAR